MDMLAVVVRDEVKTEGMLTAMGIPTQGSAVESMAKASMLEDQRLVRLEALTRAFGEGIGA